ncbi:MAG: glycoside hydrolase family 2 TIM barrel-domain containing protein [Bacteroidota bacterium]|nr:glycoside hydrolase family 2 TIM barrel-domain containing protein [Bacteroidota bacterium]
MNFQLDRTTNALKKAFGMVLLVCLTFSVENTFAADSRNKTVIDRDWKFMLGDYPGAEKVHYQDESWQPICLPHSFSMPYFLSPSFYTGYGWYRKQLMIKNESGSKHYSLEFEGVFQVCEVYVNGTCVGIHRGGYNGFSVDITKAIHPGNNVVAIRVNNLWNPRLAPRAGEHVFSGGIYRDVWLVETDALHVAWYGTFVTTPRLSETSGIVHVETELNNDASLGRNGILKTSIIDPAGKTVAILQSPFTVGPEKTIKINQTSEKILHPVLWSPATPALYKAKTEIIDNNRVVDEYETTFGMRWISWTARKGFFINGKHYYFKGCNVHQDHAGWGDAVTNTGFARDVRLMKEAGFDFIRGSHYPHDPAFSDACDSIGMLFWSENCFWGIGGFKPEGDWSCSAYPTIKTDEKAFEESVSESLKDMIRIHRNHPSVIVWSMSNEPFFTVPDKMPNVRALLKKLVSLSHKLDPTRAAAIGGCQRGDIDKLGDVAGYNGDGATLYLNPGVASVVSEYGSTVADRPGDYIPGYGALQEAQFDWRSGQAIWCGFDHGSMAGHFGCMGVVDYFRIPKKQWYWYRNAYRQIPPEKWATEGTPAAVRLSADKTVIEKADGTDDIQLMVTIVDKDGQALSNSPDVKLEIISGPGEFPTGPSILFRKEDDIMIRDGKAAIEFRSYYAGKTLIRATSPGLTPGEITLISTGAPEFDSLKNTVPVRPYVRYDAQNQIKKENQPVNLLAERPTKVSRSVDGHTADLANDRDASSCWMAGINAGEKVWWQVDMENIYLLSDIKLTFKKEVTINYLIQLSMDGETWTTVADRSAGIEKCRQCSEKIDLPVRGRFLRVVFTGSNEKMISLADIQAFGGI